jgi:hypothetical protein
MKDEYNRADLRERQLRKKSAKARIGGAFKNMDHGDREFNKIKQVFGCDVKLPEKKVPSYLKFYTRIFNNLGRKTNPQRSDPGNPFHFLEPE